MVCYYKVRQLFYYKVRQVLQSVTILLQSATGITVRRLLQSATVHGNTQEMFFFLGT